MDKLAEILRELISHAHGQGMPAGRAAELHGLVDEIAGVAEDTAEVAQAVVDVTGPEAKGGSPAAK